MKLNITITGQDDRRLAEQIEQFVRSRAANPRHSAEVDPPSQPATRASMGRDRRS